MPAAAALLITPDDLAELHRWARSAQLPAVLAQRACILLLAADGVANTQIAQRVGVSRPIAMAWSEIHSASKPACSAILAWLTNSGGEYSSADRK